jgi:hypothetical protein
VLNASDTPVSPNRSRRQTFGRRRKRSGRSHFRAQPYLSSAGPECSCQARSRAQRRRSRSARTEVTRPRRFRPSQARLLGGRRLFSAFERGGEAGAGTRASASSRSDDVDRSARPESARKPPMADSVVVSRARPRRCGVRGADDPEGHRTVPTLSLRRTNARALPPAAEPAPACRPSTTSGLWRFRRSSSSQASGAGQRVSVIVAASW